MDMQLFNTWLRRCAIIDPLYEISTLSRQRRMGCMLTPDKECTSCIDDVASREREWKLKNTNFADAFCALLLSPHTEYVPFIPGSRMNCCWSIRRNPFSHADVSVQCKATEIENGQISVMEEREKRYKLEMKLL